MPKSTPKPDSDSEIPLEETGPFVIVSGNDILWVNVTFPDKKSAEDYFRRRHSSSMYDYGYRPRPMQWREREQIRFNGEHYRPLVWENESFWTNRPQELVEHYAHRSTEDPNMIAFTENAAKGERDIQTRMKAGRYLKRFFPDLTAKKIAFLAEWAQRGARPPVDFGVLDLKFAKTPEEIVEVYKNGPSSCMSEHKDVRVYGAGDLAIAYLEPRHQEEDSDLPQYTARALVWPEKKAMGRIYPTPDAWSDDGFTSNEDAQAMQSQLFDRLKAEGYESFYEDRTIFDGARLLAIPNPDDDDGGNSWVMPYIDSNRFDGDGEDGFFRIKHNGNWSAGDTDGQTTGPWRDGGDRIDCYHCGNRTREDEAVVVTTSVDQNGHAYSDSDYCQPCADRLSWVCAGSGLRVHGVPETYRPGLGRVTQAWARSNPPLRDAQGRFVPAATTATAGVPGVRVNVFDDPSVGTALDELIHLTARF